MIAERALAIFPFFGELEAPLQVVSGNSTIIVFAGALGTDTTRWMSRSSSSFISTRRAADPVVGRLHSLDPLGVWPDVRMGLLSEPADRGVVRLVVDQVLPRVRERLHRPSLLATSGGDVGAGWLGRAPGKESNAQGECRDQKDEREKAPAHPGEATATAATHLKGLEAKAPLFVQSGYFALHASARLKSDMPQTGDCALPRRGGTICGGSPIRQERMTCFVPTISAVPRPRKRLILATPAALLLLIALPALAWGEPTRAEYIAHVEPICSAERTATKANHGLADDIQAGRIRSAVATVRRAKRIFDRHEVRIAAVPQPSADAAVLSQWLLARKNFVRTFKPLARGIKTGHVRVEDGGVLFGRPVKRFALSAISADQLVEGFGFKSCLFVRSEGSVTKPTP